MKNLGLHGRKSRFQSCLVTHSASEAVWSIFPPLKLKISYFNQYLTLIQTFLSSWSYHQWPYLCSNKFNYYRLINCRPSLMRYLRLASCKSLAKRSNLYFDHRYSSHFDSTSMLSFHFIFIFLNRNFRWSSISSNYFMLCRGWFTTMKSFILTSILYKYTWRFWNHTFSRLPTSLSKTSMAGMYAMTTLITGSLALYKFLFWFHINEQVWLKIPCTGKIQLVLLPKKMMRSYFWEENTNWRTCLCIHPNSGLKVLCEQLEQHVEHRKDESEMTMFVRSH